MNLKTTITRESKIAVTPRVQLMQGMFDVAPAATSRQTWDVAFNLPEQWQIGVVVGKSGDGKTTIARWLAEHFKTKLIGGKDDRGLEIPPWDWPGDKSILDGFPAAMGIKDIVGLLSSVGFSSPPAWLRPFHVLSNGQQFRVNLARTLAECQDVAIVDEFTSVVDRTVAQIGSAAVAKTIRRGKQRFIAVTCHYDIIDWLEPDWVYEPATNTLTLNQVADAAGRLVRRWQRPKITLRIVRADRSAWALFAQHHYLSHTLHRTSRCFVGLINGVPATITAVMHFPHPKASCYREHRTVCLPDFQGIGLGNLMSEYVASVMRSIKEYTSLTSHPAMIRHRTKSPLWRCIRKPGMVSASFSNKSTQPHLRNTCSSDRLTASFKYVGPASPEDAKRFGIHAPAANVETSESSTSKNLSEPRTGNGSTRRTLVSTQLQARG